MPLKIKFRYEAKKFSSALGSISLKLEEVLTPYCTVALTNPKIDKLTKLTMVITKNYFYKTVSDGRN